VHSVVLPDNVAAVIINPNGVVSGMNSAAEELLGEKAADFVNGILERSFEDGVIITFNDRSIRLDTLKTDLSNYVLLYDLSIQKRLEQQVEQLNQEIESLRGKLQQKHDLLTVNEKFAAIIAHEFGTPISDIRLKSYLLKKQQDQLSGEKITEHLNQIDVQLMYMVDLLDDLRLINRLHNAQSTITLTPFNLETFCKKILNDITLRSDGREIILTCDGQMNNVKLEHRLIRFVLLNLVGNAIKYSPDGGEVRVDIRAADNSITLSVSDQGIGIPANDVDKLFTQFYRASNAGDFSGIGLGLAITKTCIETYSGTIKVESKLGKGTTFIVSLPYQD
jgi:signal transduction histidine kinase